MDNEKVNLEIDESNISQTNFDEHANEEILESPMREIVRPISPHKKFTSLNAIKNEHLRKDKEMANRKRRNKEARIARRKTRR
jgi:predicted nucleotidyltransferase